MSVTRNILFSAGPDIEDVASQLNRALKPDRPLEVRMVRSGPREALKVADGEFLGYRATLYDGTDMLSESDDPDEDGLNFVFSIDCRMRRGEAEADANTRYDLDSLSLMREIGVALHTRCLLLRDMQIKIGRYP